MDYAIRSCENAVIVAVNGRVDESSWEAFGTGLREAIATAHQAGAEKVVIDLSSLDYMSSRGLRVLTVAKREGDESGVTVSLASPNDVMREILAISRYDKLFAIAESVETD